MAGWALLFAVAALTVKQDGAELREACEPGEPVVAKLAAGTPATVRFALNGCYAVDVVRDGQVIKGYLTGEQVEAFIERLSSASPAVIERIKQAFKND